VSAARRWIALVRVLLDAERGARLALLVNSVAIPLLLVYFLSRVETTSLLDRPVGALSLCLGGPMAQVGYGCVRDRFMGRLALLRTAGLQSPWAYVAARLLLGVGQAVAIAAILLAIAWVFGARPSPAGAAELMGLVALASLSLCAVSVIVVQTGRDAAQGMLLSGLVAMVLASASPVFIAASAPAPLRAVLSVSPYARLVDPFRDVMGGATVQPGDALWLSATGLACLAAIRLGVTTRLFQR
jgi:ABC-type multidrug transport system permease subunit